ncbi:MAG: DNA repair protein RecO [Patescibacteria group bacterium]
MHKLFVSDGIVLSKRVLGEANTHVALLTKELGLIKASARSARVEKSKLRYGLEPLTRGTFSLIRGKYEWKVTGVSEISNQYTVPTAASRRIALGRVTRLILRLVQGEEPVPALYGAVVEGFQFLIDARDQQDADAIEIVLVLRILAQLGYLPKTSELEPFTSGDLFSIELAAAAARSRATLIRAINTSLESTGL